VCPRIEKNLGKGPSAMERNDKGERKGRSSQWGRRKKKLKTLENCYKKAQPLDGERRRALGHCAKKGGMKKGKVRGSR